MLSNGAGGGEVRARQCVHHCFEQIGCGSRFRDDETVHSPQLEQADEALVGSAECFDGLNLERNAQKATSHDSGQVVTLGTRKAALQVTCCLLRSTPSHQVSISSGMSSSPGWAAGAAAHGGNHR